MLQAFAWLFLGLLGLVLGADVALDTARRSARRWGISELVVGLTIVSIGTSLPELATTAGGAFASTGEGGMDAAGVAVGNILGSNLFLLSALLGGVSVVSALPVGPRLLRRDGGVLLAATVVVGIFLFDGSIGRVEGSILVLAYVAYLLVLVVSERREPSPSAEEAAALGNRIARLVDLLPGPEWARDALGVVLGLSALLVSATVVVDQGVTLARMLGVSGTLVGILIGVGTSLPELVVSIRAAMANATQLTIGNIIGSSITNLLLCLGVAAVAQPMTVPDVARAYDLPFCLAITAVALLLMGERQDVTRREGGALIVLFGLFLFVRMVWVQ